MFAFTPLSATYIAWAAWAVSWELAAIWSSRAQSRPAIGVEVVYRVFTSIGVLLLLLTAEHNMAHVGRVRFHTLPLPQALTTPLWTLPEPTGWACAILAVVSFLFAWWARIHLGALWSSSITRKADHRIVDTGPYGLVRHPIYTGLIGAAVALAAVKASPAALLGLAVMSFGYWLKGRTEENFLRQELGMESYDAYRRRVPMLVPFFPV